MQEVQAFLNVWRGGNGFATLVEDGVVGPVTVDAINAFQEVQGGNGDGQILVADTSDVDGGQIATGDLGTSDEVQGQGDGTTIKEACEAAKADCKEKANCSQDNLKMRKCLCWRGGELGFTCQVKCGCSTPVA
ncbi:peptidoglycan-binding domain-containing protein [Streptomyces sp. NPDC001027]|uniref:peptidoglycan-binding domain-containing protein n=1 Tax=Streptomyces sp. NPDC001027 TaxID=3154771 RepID=UPI00331ABDED